MAETARSLGLEVTEDFARNLYMTLPGADRAAPSWITGSHLDSVPCGGNYDGAAGVVAALAAIEALRRSRLTPPRDVTVMAVRAEEAGSWFRGEHKSLIGSRAALGRLDAKELRSAICVESGSTLADRMVQAGVDVESVAKRRTVLDPKRHRGFIELHIEQGPVLEDAKISVGIVSAIRGGLWARECMCRGRYAHAGAEPRVSRRDTVMATSRLIADCETRWAEIEGRGGDLVFTVGKLHTDPNVNALTKVSGEVKFCLDIRSGELAVLKDMKSYLSAQANSLAVERGVTFDFGPMTLIPPTDMNAALRKQMDTTCSELGITARHMPSGGGHDAEEFANAGIPTAMIFVRNQNGSHNPNEAMRLDDFTVGARLLTGMIMQ
jgi:N-carbamoyl-L-amino-acid hydrolase